MKWNKLLHINAPKWVVPCRKGYFKISNVGYYDLDGTGFSETIWPFLRGKHFFARTHHSTYTSKLWEGRLQPCAKVNCMKWQYMLNRWWFTQQDQFGSWSEKPLAVSITKTGDALYKSQTAYLQYFPFALLWNVKLIDINND